MAHREGRQWVPRVSPPAPTGVSYCGLFTSNNPNQPPSPFKKPNLQERAAGCTSCTLQCLPCVKCFLGGLLGTLILVLRAPSLLGSLGHLCPKKGHHDKDLRSAPSNPHALGGRKLLPSYPECFSLWLVDRGGHSEISFLGSKLIKWHEKAAKHCHVSSAATSQLCLHASLVHVFSHLLTQTRPPPTLAPGFPQWTAPALTHPPHLP